MTTETRFFRAAVVAFAAGLVVQTTKAGALLADAAPPAWLPDAMHLLTAGGIGFALLGLLVRVEPSLAPDERFRKGPAPRAYFTFALGVVLAAFVAPFATRSTFFAALTLAGWLLEIAALGMVLLARTSGGLGRN